MYFRRRRKRSRLGAIGDKQELDGTYAQEEQIAPPRIMFPKPGQKAQETSTAQAASWLQVCCESHVLWCACGDPITHLCAISATLRAAPAVPPAAAGAGGTEQPWPGAGVDGAGGSGAGPGAADGCDRDWDDVDLAALLDDVEGEDVDR